MFKKAIFLALALATKSSLAADIFVADRLYAEGEYQQAKKEYAKAAERGNPHAYYQLATMLHKGLGGAAEPVNAMMYFYLAAEQGFHNAQSVIDKILTSLPEEQQAQVLVILEDYKQSHGKDQINQRLFPQINSEVINTKLTFDGKDTIETVFHPEDVDLDDFDTMLAEDSFVSADADEIAGDGLELIISTPTTPFLIIDHDVHTDGSVRYTSEVQKFGNYKSLQDEFTLFSLSAPDFDGRPAQFASRSYLGAAGYSKFTMREQNPQMYEQILHKAKKLRKGTSINDQYYLAMLMQNFPWVEQGENEAEDLLLKLSQQGHSPAMYEYGFKLYREQRDLEQAIYWIGQASKYGLARAEYRLAKILQSSPWVHRDDKKALFWFESAMNKGNQEAHINATEILFTSKDKSINNYTRAVAFLETLEEANTGRPEVNYLAALKYKTGEHRNIKLAVENLETAIFRGELSNWDVSQWQALLEEITTGEILVTDYDNPQ